VNKTESAVRITHIPSGIVVACQASAASTRIALRHEMLKSKLYELEFNKRNAAAKVLEDSKSDVSWAIRSAATCWINRASRTFAPAWRSQYHGRARRCAR